MRSVARAYTSGTTTADYDKYAVELLSIKTGWTEREIKESSAVFIQNRIALENMIGVMEKIREQRQKNG